MYTSSIHIPRYARASGFTLVELMIVVLIVGILAAVALPSYQSSVRKGRRAEAKTALLDLAARQERYLSVNNIYADTPAKLGLPGSTFPINVTVGSRAYYKLVVAVGSSPIAFTASAVPLSTQSADPCGTYSLNSLGVQGNTNTSGSVDNCW